jgi:hypothetical protein
MTNKYHSHKHESKPALLSVYDGRTCLGFVLNRGRSGFEAFDRNGRSFGLFPTTAAAANAITCGRVQ